MACRIQAINGRAAGGRGGFTLVESLVASVVLAITVLGVCGELAASYQQTMVSNQTAVAVALGRQLLDEIGSKPLADPANGNTTPTATALGGPRSAFTCVGNYNLYTDSGSSLATLGGLTVNATGGQSFTRLVSITLGVTPSGDVVSPGTDFAVATVTVTMPSGQTISLSRVLSNYTFSR